VNKRVSRITASIPLIKRNLAPRPFANAPPQTYTEAVLVVYELIKIDLLNPVFIWAYERSPFANPWANPLPFGFATANGFGSSWPNLSGRAGSEDAAARIAVWSEEEIDPDYASISPKSAKLN
jgi:hypothetical protein